MGTPGPLASASPSVISTTSVEAGSSDGDVELAAAEVDRAAGEGNASSDDLVAFAFFFGAGLLLVELAVVYRFLNLFRAAFPDEDLAPADDPPPPRPLLRTDRSWASLAKMGSFMSSDDDDDDDDSSDEDDWPPDALRFRWTSVEALLTPSSPLELLLLLLLLLLSSSSAMILRLLVCCGLTVSFVLFVL